MKQKELFPRSTPRTITEQEAEALGLKYLGNIYYYCPEKVRDMIRAIEKILRGRK
jgi:hypothetical protein